MKNWKKTWAAHLMRACSDFFVEIIVTQFQLVLEIQFYLSSIPLGAHQEESNLVFWLPLKLESLDFNIVLNLRSPSGI